MDTSQLQDFIAWLQTIGIIKEAEANELSCALALDAGRADKIFVEVLQRMRQNPQEDQASLISSVVQQWLQERGILRQPLGQHRQRLHWFNSGTPTESPSASSCSSHGSDSEPDPNLGNSITHRKVQWIVGTRTDIMNQRLKDPMCSWSEVVIGDSLPLSEAWDLHNSGRSQRVSFASTTASAPDVAFEEVSGRISKEEMSSQWWRQTSSLDAGEGTGAAAVSQIDISFSADTTTATRSSRGSHGGFPKRRPSPKHIAALQRAVMQRTVPVVVRGRRPVLDGRPSPLSKYSVLPDAFAETFQGLRSWRRTSSSPPRARPGRRP
mmetsp:Transcript_7967/g.17725  ORF Transcript_7967/g.17725 Transcript_7967/m.17725 type:complete len:323 (+) Transcript_7967:65-1033(+)